MSNKQGEIASRVISEMSEINARYIKEDNKVLNIADLLEAMYYRETYVNGKQSGTVFGIDYIVGQEKTAMSGKGDLGIPIYNFYINYVGDSYLKITDNESTFELGSGTGVNSEIIAWTKKAVRYEPGKQMFIKFTAAFPKLEDSNGDYTIGIGFLSPSDGLALVQRRRNNQLEYGLIVRKDSVDEFFPLDNAEYVEDFNILNIFYIKAGYLGVADTDIFLSDDIFYRLMRKKYVQRTTSVKVSNLNFGAFIKNEGNTNNIKLLNGSYEGGTINGGQVEDTNVVIRTFERSQLATSGTNQLIFAFKNPKTTEKINYVDNVPTKTYRVFHNQVASRLLQVDFTAAESNKTTNIDLYIADEDAILTGTFNYVDKDASVILASTDATFDLTNALKIEKFRIVKDSGTGMLDIVANDLLLPKQVAIFVYSTTSVNFTLESYIKYQDRK